MIIWKDLTIRDSTYTVKAAPISSGIQFTKSNGANASITVDTLYANGLNLPSTLGSWASNGGLTVASISSFKSLATFTQGLKVSNGNLTIGSTGKITLSQEGAISGSTLTINNGATIGANSGGLTVERGGLTINGGGLAVNSGATNVKALTVSDTFTTTGASRMTYNNHVPKCKPGVVISAVDDNDVCIVPVLPPVVGAKITVTWQRGSSNRSVTFTSKGDTYYPYNITVDVNDSGYGNTKAIDSYYCNIDMVKDIQLTIKYSNSSQQHTWTRTNGTWDNEQALGGCIVFTDVPDTHCWYPEACTGGYWFKNDNRSLRVISPTKSLATANNSYYDNDARIFFKALMTVIAQQHLDLDGYNLVWLARSDQSPHRLWSSTGLHVWKCDIVENEFLQGTVYDLWAINA